jgi:hypothetical protein
MVESKKTDSRVISNEFKSVSLDIKRDETQEKMKPEKRNESKNKTQLDAYERYHTIEDSDDSYYMVM